MSMALSPTNQQLAPHESLMRRRERSSRTWGYVAGLAVVATFAAVGLLSLVLVDKSSILPALGAGIVVALCVIRWPVLGTYLTAGIAILFDQFTSATVSTLISNADVYRNIVYLNVPEILLILALGSTLVRRLHRHERLNQGPLFWPMVIFGALVVVGEIIGMLGGGDFKTSLWEIRPLLYLVMFYILAVNTVKGPQHIRTLLGITIVCILLRSFEGVFRYLIMPADVRSVAQVVLEHDDSLFFALGIALLPAVVLWRRWLPKWMLYTLAAMSPLVLYMIGINQRRAAYVCIAFVLVTYLPMVWLSVRSKAQRRMMVKMLIMASVLGSAYLALFWNSTNGLFSKPAQSIKSVINPDERDYSSNLYRDIETENLRFTISTSPLLGIGFGRPFIVVRPLVDLTNTWVFQLYMPHNNMLWVWMRTGIIGFANFWAIIGLSIMLIVTSVRLGAARLKVLQIAEREILAAETSRIVIERQSRAVRTQMRECAEFLVFVFAVHAILISLLVLALLDQGLMGFRLMIYAGLALGALTSTWNANISKFKIPEGVNLGALPEKECEPNALHARKQRRVRYLAGTG